MNIPNTTQGVNDKDITIQCRLCGADFEKIESEGASVCYKCYKAPKMETQLNTGKCTGHEINFLESIGWKVFDAWTIEGKEPVEIAKSFDRWTQGRIIDKRFISYMATIKN